MNKNYCERTDIAEEDKNWYYVPPYGDYNQKIVNANGELIATFENKSDALCVVELHNQNL